MWLMAGTQITLRYKQRCFASVVVVGAAVEQIQRPVELFTQQKTCHFMGKGQFGQ